MSDLSTRILEQIPVSHILTFLGERDDRMPIIRSFCEGMAAGKQDRTNQDLIEAVRACNKIISLLMADVDRYDAKEYGAYLKATNKVDHLTDKVPTKQPDIEMFNDAHMKDIDELVEKYHAAYTRVMEGMLGKGHEKS